MSRKMKCKKCGMILESKSQHDLQECKCGNFIDGIPSSFILFEYFKDKLILLFSLKEDDFTKLLL